jgi:amidase
LPARFACIFSLLGIAFVANASAQTTSRSFELMEATIPQLQAALVTGTITSRGLVTAYLARIDAYDQHGPALNAISVVNSHALDEAAAMDAERRAGAVRGLLHGIPIIVKDNYETADMQTAAGSVYLAGWLPPTDATLVRKLRAAGAIIIAHANMQEFAYGFANVGSLGAARAHRHRYCHRARHHRRLRSGRSANCR